MKCLCNLAVAHAQLQDFDKAKEIFTSALEKATLVNDHILQLQAHEGLGSVYYQMKKFPKAKESFHNALAVLHHIKYDTGLARERVMEKISDVVEAEQQQMVSFQNALDSQSKRTLQRDHSMSDPTRPTSALGHSSGLQSSTTNDISKSLSSTGIDSTGIQAVRPNLSNVVESDHDGPSGSRPTRHLSNIDEFNQHAPVRVPTKKKLTPLSTPQMVQPMPLPCVITVADGNNKSIQSHLELQQTIKSLQYGTATDGSSHNGTFSTANTPVYTKRTPALVKTPLSSRSTPATATTRNSSARNMPTSSSRLDAYNEDYEQQLLNDYMNTYAADDNYKVFSTDSREQTDSDSGNDELGASIFSRNASRQKSSRQRMSRPPRTPYRRKILTPRVPQVVQEGSLAISPIARQEYETNKNKKSDAQNILRISSASSSHQTRQPRVTNSSSPANTSRSSQLSRVCVIL